MTVAPGLYSYGWKPEPQYLPALWSAHAHPEGSVYFVRDTLPRVVTDANMYEIETQDAVARWLDVMDDVLREKTIDFTEHVELYIKPARDNQACDYYFVDHKTRVEFWYESVDVQLLDLDDAVSNEHIRHALEEHYWTHVEHFPSHDPYGLDLEMPVLLATLIHGQADQLTSSTSTFPYSAQECSSFIDILKASQDQLHSAQVRWSIARLWSMICHHRFIIHSGEKHCRLSRDQSILAKRELSQSLVYTAVDRLLFSIPNFYDRSLQELWVDELVYLSPWERFIKACQAEWTAIVAWTFGVMICNLLLIIGSLGSPWLACASLAICNVDIVCTVYLIMQNQLSAFGTTKEAALYLSNRYSERSGFRNTAILFSLPRALLLWALLISSCQSVVWLAALHGHTALVTTPLHRFTA